MEIGPLYLCLPDYNEKRILMTQLLFIHSDAKVEIYRDMTPV